MNKTDFDFIEVEHKFLVDETFNKKYFFEQLKKLNPINHYSTQVEDNYFIFTHNPKYIYRHRYDSKLQNLTAKTNRYMSNIDIEVREEVNILLSQNLNNQFNQVCSFLKSFGPLWSDCIHKKVTVFEYSDCEICHYEATTNNNKQIYYCVEFEAKNFSSVENAKNILKKYEKNLNFNNKTRESKSIFELLFAQELLNIFGSSQK